VFHDPFNNDSLGFHEATSSAENYYCRPLSPAEHDVISVDTMTCPSPNVFKTDKGEFDGDNTSVYPPRNDILEVSPSDAAEVAQTFADINDLDAVTAATPIGDKPEYITAMIPAEVVANGPLTAWIEVSLEHDENAAYDYDRDKDHYVDPSLSAYGVEYLGQPSVVYKLQFDPRAEGFLGTSDYAGYGDWDGKPPAPSTRPTPPSRAATAAAPTACASTPSTARPSASASTATARRRRRPDRRRRVLRRLRQRLPAARPTTAPPTTTANDGDDDGGWGHCRPRELPPSRPCRSRA
jgi:hypothetical protein